MLQPSNFVDEDHRSKGLDELPIITNRTKSEQQPKCYHFDFSVSSYKAWWKKGSHTSKKETVKYTFYSPNQQATFM